MSDNRSSSGEVDDKSCLTPLYFGHRVRVKNRLLQHGGDVLEDYELLEALLFYAIPRRDVRDLAKNLLQKFGSLRDILGAQENALVEAGLTSHTICLFKLALSMGSRLARTDVLDKPIMSQWAQLISYLTVRLAHEKIENFHVLFLDRKNRLIADETQQRGTVDHTPAYVREVLKRALELGATALILVHNHPSGDPTPSHEDIKITNDLVEAAKSLQIQVHDHVIISRQGHASLRNLGLM
ncbi:MAG: RadC family protein [Alphaproteobacteria bacterium]